MMNRRQFLGGAAGLMALGAGLRPAASQTPLRLGSSLPLTGPDAALGQEIQALYRALLEELPNVQLDFLDDASDATRMDANFRKLDANRTSLAVAVLGAERLRSLSRSASGLRALTLGPDALAGSDGRLSVRPDLEAEAVEVARGAARANLQKVGVVYGLDAEGRAYRKALGEALRAAGLEIVAEASSQTGGSAEQMPREVSAELRKRGAQLLVSAERGVLTGSMARVSRDFGWGVPMICSSLCDAALLARQTLEVSPQLASGVVLARALGTVGGDDSLSLRYESLRSASADELGAASELGLEASVQADLLRQVASSGFLTAEQAVASLSDAIVAFRRQPGAPKFFVARDGSWRTTDNWIQALAA